MGRTHAANCPRAGYRHVWKPTRGGHPGPIARTEDQNMLTPLAAAHSEEKAELVASVHKKVSVPNLNICKDGSSDKPRSARTPLNQKSSIDNLPWWMLRPDRRVSNTYTCCF